MGGNHKKFLKSEKAKIKLKATKLKGPQNVTKTDFKVRKIVITEQLKNVQVRESGVRKVHSFNDCLARLKNSSSAEALSNLKDIILYQPDDLNKHLEEIIKIAANLALSIEKNDRKECFKILDLICSQTPENNLQPFFSILLTYLKCAMTHIKPGIQEDSLLMLDVLLKHAPTLMAKEKDNVLPSYLNMISRMRIEEKPERTLSMQMGNKITTMKWRKNVLERLILFLKCISEAEITKVEEHSKDDNKREIIVNEKHEYLQNIYTPTLWRSNVPLFSIESHLKSITSKSPETEVKVLKYCDMIMPLMFETWMEVKPAQTTTLTGELRTSLTLEASIMLKVVLDIMMELHNMAEETSQDTKVKFLHKNLEKFDQYLVTSFPFIQDDSSLKTPESGGARCVYQNLSVAIIYLSFVGKHKQRFFKSREKIFKFIENSIQEWKSKDQEFNSSMKNFISRLFKPEMVKIFPDETKQIFHQLVKNCNVDQMTYDPKLELVCNIIEKSNVSSKDSIYSMIIPQMVRKLGSSDHVPVHIIDTISTLSKQGNKVVFENLESSMIEIVRNLLGKMKIIGNLDQDELRIKLKIANLVYWIQNQDTLKTIQTNLKNDTISRYIRDIVSVKVN